MRPPKNYTRQTAESLSAMEIIPATMIKLASSADRSRLLPEDEMSLLISECEKRGLI